MRQVWWYNRDVFSIFFNMKVYCVFSLESPQRGNSNEYPQYTISQYKKETHPKLSQICKYGIFSKGHKKEFEPAVVNEPSVFEPLKFYCIRFCDHNDTQVIFSVGTNNDTVYTITNITRRLIR